MSFWALSDGTDAAQIAEKEYEIPGGNLDPIPDGSSVLALIDEAKWDNRDDASYISLRWSVLSPDEFKNRKIYQKLWVTDDDPNAKDADRAAKKRDKARRMLAAIDTNAGGHLVKVGGEPTDDALTANLANKPMIIKCMIWSMPDREMPGEVIEGNWIAAVGPASKGIAVAEPKPRRATARTNSPPLGGAAPDQMDDEIPF